MTALALYPPHSQNNEQDDLSIPALWSMVLRKECGLPPILHPDRDFTEKTWLDILHNCQHVNTPTSTALAVSLPLEKILTGQNLQNMQTSARHYLDHLLLEMRLLHKALQPPIRIQTFWLLGDALHWLQPAELTELIFKTRRLFPSEQSDKIPAILELANWPEQEGIWALVAGLGFTHLVARGSLLKTHQPQLQDIAQVFKLGLLCCTANPEHPRELITLEPSRRAPHLPDGLPSVNALLGAGIDGQSFVGPHYINNQTQLDAYYQDTASGQLPIARGGTWRDH